MPNVTLFLLKVIALFITIIIGMLIGTTAALILTAILNGA
jgi:hypothetical protein